MEKIPRAVIKGRKISVQITIIHFYKKPSYCLQLLSENNVELDNQQVSHLGQYLDYCYS